MTPNAKLNKVKNSGAAKDHSKSTVSKAWLVSFALTSGVSIFAACGFNNNNKETAVTDCPTVPDTFNPGNTVSTAQNLTGPAENAQAAAFQLAEAPSSSNNVFASGNTDGQTFTFGSPIPGVKIETEEEKKKREEEEKKKKEEEERAKNECTGFCSSNQEAAKQFGQEGTQAASQANKAAVDKQRTDMKTEQDTQNNLTPCTPPANFQPTTLDANKQTGQTNTKADNTLNNGGGSPSANPIGGIDKFGTDLQAKASVSPKDALTNATQTIGALPSTTPIPQTSSAPKACEDTGGLSSGSGSEISSANGNCATRKGNTNF